MKNVSTGVLDIIVSAGDLQLVLGLRLAWNVSRDTCYARINVLCALLDKRHRQSVPGGDACAHGGPRGSRGDLLRQAPWACLCISSTSNKTVNGNNQPGHVMCVCVRTSPGTHVRTVDLEQKMSLLAERQHTEVQARSLANHAKNNIAGRIMHF